MYYETIGERIKFLRKKSGMSQEELASLLGITKQAIYKYENSIVTNIPMDKIEILAQIFHVSPAYIMGWNELNTESITPSPEISENEAILLELFRQVPAEHQEMVLGMIRVAIGNQVPPKSQ